MNSKKCIVASALLLAVGFTSFASGQPTPARETREQAKARLTAVYEDFVKLSAEKAAELKAAFDARRTAELIRPARMCHVFMTVDWIPPGPNPHLRIDDVVLLVGPIPHSGIYQVTPISVGPGNAWNHPWKQGHYFAKPRLSQPNLYDLDSVSVAPHGGDDEVEHAYNMEVTEMENNCPSYAIFSGACHVGFPCPLDPGHAGVTR